MKEIWKEIRGWEGKYEISSLGRCRTVQHIVQRKDGTSQVVKGRIKIPHDNRKGYLAYAIGSKKRLYAHRLVAEAFIPNPMGYTEIDHIDANKSNNTVENLRWTDRKGNVNNPITKIKMKCLYEKQKKPVVELDIYGNYIREWRGANDIMRAKGLTSIFINKNNEKLRLTGDRVYVAALYYDKNKNYGKIYGRRTRFIDNVLNSCSVVELSKDGYIVNVFSTTTDAAKHFGLTRGSISLRCNNRRKGVTMRKPPLLMYYKDLSKELQHDALQHFILNSSSV